MTNTALESLRTFALTHNEVAFAHLVTAALAGEEWAVICIEEYHGKVGSLHLDDLTEAGVKLHLDAIRSTDTSRPDGAVARTLLAP